MNKGNLTDGIANYDQELKEREDAAIRYSIEDEPHFIAYGNDCVDTSVKDNDPIRKVQKECYAVYKEDEPANYAKKENWQSKVVIPKPFSAVQTAMSAVRKAFAPNFLSIQNETNKDVAEFWEKLMIHQLNEDHANFSIKFIRCFLAFSAVLVNETECLIHITVIKTS